MGYRNKSAWDVFMDAVFDEAGKEIKKNKELQNHLNDIKDAVFDGAQKGLKQGLGISDEKGKK